MEHKKVLILKPEDKIFLMKLFSIMKPCSNTAWEVRDKDFLKKSKEFFLACITCEILYFCTGGTSNVPSQEFEKAMNEGVLRFVFIPYGLKELEEHGFSFHNFNSLELQLEEVDEISTGLDRGGAYERQEEVEGALLTPQATTKKPLLNLDADHLTDISSAKVQEYLSGDLGIPIT